MTTTFTISETNDLMVEPDEHAPARRIRWHRRTRARAIAYAMNPNQQSDDDGPLRRLKTCGIAKASDVEIRIENHRAYAHGLISCGNIWTCPTCSEKIRVRRTAEIQAALARHCEAGGMIGMLTLTLRHDRTMPLTETLDRLNNAWRNLQQRKSWRKFREQLDGTIATTEITYNDTNGWHPHLHITLLARPGSTYHSTRTATNTMRKSWSKLANKRTDRHSLEHGLNLVWFGKNSAAAAKYVGKIAKEMTLTDTKNGNDPFALLDLNTQHATDLFIEYAHATRGHQLHRWSAGLKTRLGVAEKTDEEIKEDDQTVGDHALTIDAKLWNSITENERLAWLEFAEAQHKFSSA